METARGGKGLGIGGHQKPFRGLTDDWLTPPDIIRTLGPFDLDPCSAPSPRPWPTAADHIEPPRDGLSEEWKGRVWMNPPYGPRTGSWLKRLSEYGNGIALTFARTETEMFHRYVWERADAILFLEGRLYFHKTDGTRAKHNSGAPSALIAYGKDSVKKLSSCGIRGAFVRLR